MKSPANLVVRHRQGYNRHIHLSDSLRLFVVRLQEHLDAFYSPNQSCPDVPPKIVVKFQSIFLKILPGNNRYSHLISHDCNLPILEMDTFFCSEFQHIEITYQFVFVFRV